MLNFVGKRYWFFLFSALIIVPGLVSLAIPPRLKLGLDFTGGKSQTISFLHPVAQDDLRAEVTAQGHPNPQIQRSSSLQQVYLVEIKPLGEVERRDLEAKLKESLGLHRLVTFPLPEGSERQTQALVFSDVETIRNVDVAKLTQELTTLGYSDAAPERAELSTYLIKTRAPKGMTEEEDREKLEAALEAKFGRLASYDFGLVSAIVASERARNAAYAVAAASVAILLYITWAFRRLPNPFLYGTFAVIALIHDTLVVVGIFSLMGKALGTEIDSTFIAGVLTVIGFSVHDTIVVFDRIRENIARGQGRELGATINMSLNETLARSINTSLTLFFMLFAMALLGGSTLRNFVLVLIIGITAGTYSSICIASQLLVTWERGDLRKLVRKLPILARGR